MNEDGCDHEEDSDETGSTCSFASAVSDALSFTSLDSLFSDIDVCAVPGESHGLDDSSGEAVPELPAWFGTRNTDRTGCRLRFLDADGDDTSVGSRNLMIGMCVTLTSTVLKLIGTEALLLC